MKKNGFTLIEILGVLVILSIILAIAVPSITGVIENSKREAFKSDAKLVLKAINYQKLNNDDFDVTSINKNNVNTILGLSNENYDSVSVYVEEGEVNPEITIIGTGKWDDLIACGTSMTMRIVESTSDCSTDIVPPVIEIMGDNPFNIFVGSSYTDPGFTATDDREGNITSRTIVYSDINPNKPGTYTITYSVMDMAGNETIVNRTVNVIDNEKPVITLNPSGMVEYAKNRTLEIKVSDRGTLDNVSLKYLWSISATEPAISEFVNSYVDGQSIVSPTGVSGTYYLWAMAADSEGNTTIIKSNSFNLDNERPVITLNGDSEVTIDVGSVYTDAGAIATDNVDNDVTVTATGFINPNAVGTYTVTYNATDSVGNTANPVIRTVNVVDVKAPVITILGTNPVNINIGSSYTDAGATALDDVDGDITSKIVVTSNINPNVVGTYNVTYRITDTAGNDAIAVRTVDVIDNVKPTIAIVPNGNSTYAKTRSTTVTVSDNVAVNTSSLKYLWTTSTTQPAEVSFTTSFTSGSTVSTPVGVTGTYYLWILAKDTSGNTIISGSNVFNIDNTIPVITMNGTTPVTISVGATYTDAGATATDAHSGINGTVTSTGSVNPNAVGTYTVTYNVSDNAGNAAVAVVRTINVVDATVPTVSFGTNGNSTYAKTRSTTVTVSDNVSVNTSSLKYLWNTSTTTPTEPSFSLTFTNGGTISSPAGATGTYYLWVLAKDTSNNVTIVRTNAFNLDNVAPTLTLTGSSSVTITRESTYTDAGATATDNINGNITASISTTGSVNPNVIGTYTITYNVSDTAGNAATPVTRTVNVITAVPAGWTAIRTATELSNIRNNLGLSYYIDNDITLTGMIWSPIYSFAGNLDGGGHKIIGLNTTSTGTTNVGLFGTITGANVEIKNLEFTNVSLVGSANVGTVVGLSSGSNLKITNVKMSGTITGYSSQVGGLIGQAGNTLTVSGSSAAGTLSTGGSSAGGLIGYTSYNTTVSGSYATNNVTGSSGYAGGLIGQANNATFTISNSYSTGAISGSSSSFAGGLIGYLLGSPTVTNSYATGNVTAASYVGGLMGYTNGGTISKSYASGNVTSTTSGTVYTGGLIGQNSTALNDCYALGDVIISNGGNSHIGGLIGANYATIARAYSIGKVTGASIGGNVGPMLGYNNGTTSYLYWVMDTSLIYSTNYPATSINTIVAGTYAGTYAGFDFAGTWETISGSTTPYIKGMMLTTKNYISATQNYARQGAGTPSDPYIIKTPEDLNQMRTSLYASFKLANDITLTGMIWSPIYSFAGNLDGNGYKIIGLNTTTAGNSNVGLFGTVTGANVEIKNIEFTNVSLVGSANVGTVVGLSSGSNLKITNVKMSGTITGYSSQVGGLIGQAGNTLTVSGSSAAGTLSTGGSSAGGLIGYTSYNTTVSGSYATNNVTGSSGYAGGLIGQANNATFTISNSYSTGAISGSSSSFAGGLVGYLLGSPTVTNSYATGNVTAASYVGGLMGYTNGGTISKSYASGNVTSTTSGTVYTGGLIGQNSTALNDCYALGNVIISNGGNSQIGGLVGANYATIARAYSIGKVTGASIGGNVGPILGFNNGTTSNIYWIMDTSLIYSTNYPATSINTIVAGTYAGTYAGFDFTGTWETISGSTTPYIKGMMLTTKNYISATQNYARQGAGTPSDPYIIKTPEDLNQMRTSLYASFKLANDITLTGTSYDIWSPIYSFAGNLDGNGYKIIGLKTTTAGNSNVGLFGTITGANVEIKNLEFTNVSLVGSANIGTVVGLSSGSNLKITNVKMSGTITGYSSQVGGLIGQAGNTLTVSGSSAAGTLSTGGSSAGGLIGYTSYNTTVSGSYANNNVTGSSGYAGGLIGQANNATFTISNSYSTGAISGSSSSFAGGLVGYLLGSPTVTNSYATGNVTAASYVGGLMGYTNGGTISKSYASGNVTSTTSGTVYTGGLIGQNSTALNDCYALGNVIMSNGGNSQIGGLVGANYATITRSYSIGRITGASIGGYVGPMLGFNNGTTSYIYWDTTTSGTTYANYPATGLTTAQMYVQGNFASFDFTNVWIASGTTYPRLR